MIIRKNELKRKEPEFPLKVYMCKFSGIVQIGIKTKPSDRYNRYDYYRPYYDYRPQRVPPVHYDTPPKQEDHGVVTKDGYKKVPPPAPERKAKPRTGGRGQGPSDHYFEGTSFDESVPLRERMPWLWPSCDPNCGRPSQELEFRLKEFEQFQSRELERFEQFKRNERIRYIHTPIMEE